MRYIRTKEGIIVDTTKYKNVVERTFRDKVVAIDLNHWGQDNDKYPTWIDIKDIVNQADTIEELCDEFVIHYANGYHLITIKDGETTFKDGFDYGFKLKFALENGYEIYGAIWVIDSNGAPTLKSVAKMNKEGELELL